VDRYPAAGPEDVTSSSATRDSSSLWTLVAAGERVCAFVLLLILAPLLTFAALVIWLLSRRAPLVAHPRVGRNGKEFWVLKLRTMWGGSAVHWCPKSYLVERLFAAAAPEVKTARDPRVTSTFAAFCRKFSIDEFPQLYHVLRGEMSFVGPRPLTRDELSQHYGHAAREVLRLKPGLTGLWQVRGRSRLNYRQRRRLDLFLVRKWSFRLYVLLLLTTIPRVLMGTDAW
jgi:lipopolysaccharide/colanic/teichoic acid biosynthesis glycosyltransferase